MEDLIKALQIFLKYNNDRAPFDCRDETFYVDVSPDTVSSEDSKALEELSFIPSQDEDINHDGFISYRFGS